MADLISVIIPIYKVEKYLCRCLDSILNQTYKNLEIILVDDGSPDKCPEICDEYKEKDKRIKVVHKKNGGLSDARNEGLKFATGKYISFIDSDDCISCDMIEYLYDILIKNDADISVCDFSIFTENPELSSLKTSNYKNDDTKKYTNVEAIKILLNGNVSHGDYAWNKLYKRKLFDDIKYPYNKKMEDIGTTYKLYYISRYIVIGNSKKYFYYQRSDSILGNNDIKIYADGLELSLERYNFLEKKLNIDMTDYSNDLKDKIIELYKNIKTKEEFLQFYEKKYDVLLLNLKGKIKYKSFKDFIKYHIFLLQINFSKVRNGGN